MRPKRDLRKASLETKARWLRENRPKCERMLWHYFRGPMTPKFHSQVVIEPYIVDFYCHEARLVVELDGVGHATGAQARKDQKRDWDLGYRGFTVVRINNREVRQDAQAVAEELLTQAEELIRARRESHRA